MDYELDRRFGDCQEEESEKSLLEDYLKWFSEEHKIV